MRFPENLTTHNYLDNLMLTGFEQVQSLVQRDEPDGTMVKVMEKMEIMITEKEKMKILIKGKENVMEKMLEKVLIQYRVLNLQSNRYL